MVAFCRDEEVRTKFCVFQSRVNLSNKCHKAQAFSFTGTPLLNADNIVARNQPFLNYATICNQNKGEKVNERRADYLFCSAAYW